MSGRTRATPTNTPGNRPLPPVETRWKPGQSGNPAGRPKGSGRLSKALCVLMLEPYPDDPRGRTYAEVVAESLAKAAVSGDVSAIRELGDRTEGKATQRIENVEFHEGFNRMTPEELLRYAATGVVPDWFNNAERGTSHESN
jgi:Family of unknown function (DUF5681)